MLKNSNSGMLGYRYGSCVIRGHMDLAKNYRNLNEWLTYRELNGGVQFISGTEEFVLHDIWS